MTSTRHLDKARAAWGDRLPGWIEGLALECCRTSQNQVAGRMGISASWISQILGNKYPSRLDRVRDIYLGVYESEVVECPALGRTPLNMCRHWRSKSRALQSANAQNVMMFRACNRCHRNREEEEDE